MPLQPFTRNYQDNSTEAGFQFTFNCDICNDGYKTNFIASKTYKKKGLWRGLGQVASIGSEIAGRWRLHTSTRRRRHERTIPRHDTRMAQRT